MATWLRLAALVPLALWGPALAAAQDPASLPPPVTLSHAEGRVEIARVPGVAPAQVPDLLDEGDRLLTADGRAELVFADGSLVHVDRDTDLHIENGARLRLVRGRVLVRTTPAGSPLDLATPVGVVRFAPRGDYEIAVRDLDGATVIAARAGHATLTQAERDVPIAADDELWLDPRGGEPRWTRVGTRRDAFIDWAEARVAEMRTSSSSQPLPVELAAYAPTFEEYGQWDTLPVYGAAWFPRVGAGWRPYAQGIVAAHAARLDLDRSASVGLAGAPLRPLGPASFARLVLDAAPHVGPGLGRLGRGGRLRGVGAARLELACRSWTSSRPGAAARWTRGPAAGR